MKKLLTKIRYKLGFFTKKEVEDAYVLGKRDGLKIQNQALAEIFEEKINKIIN